MNQFFIDFSAFRKKDHITITGDDAKHISSVLRLRPGEELQAVNPDDCMTYTCEVVSLDKNEVICRITDIQKESTELPVNITLYQGFPKGDKFEFIIQKAVEMGVYEIVPVQMRRSVVKMDPKKIESKLKRWQSIAKSAAEQSKRKIIPEVKPICTFDEALNALSCCDTAIVPYELAEGMDDTRDKMQQVVKSIKERTDVSDKPEIAVYIGPEGGFADEEIEKLKENDKTVVITLGRRILRTETAPIAILAWLTYLLEE